jgi:hypothetical protein
MSWKGGSGSSAAYKRCVVCSEPMEKDHRPMLLNCNHVMGESCLKELVVRRCPICTDSIVSATPISEDVADDVLKIANNQDGLVIYPEGGKTSKSPRHEEPSPTTYREKPKVSMFDGDDDDECCCGLCTWSRIVYQALAMGIAFPFVFMGVGLMSFTGLNDRFWPECQESYAFNYVLSSYMLVTASCLILTIAGLITSCSKRWVRIVMLIPGVILGIIGLGLGFYAIPRYMDARGDVPFHLQVEQDFVDTVCVKHVEIDSEMYDWFKELLRPDRGRRYRTTGKNYVTRRTSRAKAVLIGQSVSWLVLMLLIVAGMGYLEYDRVKNRPY